MRRLLILSALVVASLASVAVAQCPRCGQFHPPYDRPTPVRNVLHAAASLVAGNDALAEVNAARARRGLRPFLHDPLLTEGARRCAGERARRRIQGHLANDFAYLPSGAQASAGGCAAWEPSMGWGACCTYDNYTYAGAAWAIGADGRRYMHLFVR